jgi:hypothetical protein
MALFSLAHGLGNREAEIVAACACGTHREPAIDRRSSHEGLNASLIRRRLT